MIENYNTAEQLEDDMLASDQPLFGDIRDAKLNYQYWPGHFTATFVIGGHNKEYCQFN